jgi:DNA invertase Pin-like site-specific DNA recombinase
MATTPNRPLRVIGYVRVSTDKQEVGPEVQIDTLTAEAAKMGWQLTIVREDAKSAATISGRPLIRQALADLKAKKFDALAVAKLDRLSRSTDDGSTLLTNSTRQGWAIICLDLGVDTATIMGAGMYNMALNFAEMERRRIGERTRETMARIKASDPDKHMGRPSVLPASTLDRIAELRASGLSMARTAAALIAEDVPTATGGTWHASTVRAVENSAAYAARHQVHA